MDERLAIARLKQHDIGGLELLVRFYYVQAVRTSYVITRDKAIAEDIVQEAFLHVYDRIDQFDDTRPFAPWFMRCVLNDSVKAIARNRHFVSLEARRTQTDASLEDILPAEFNELDQLEMEDAIWEALDRLSPSQRAAVVLRYYLEFSEVEAAQALDCPPNTLKWWMSQARLHLRALLQPLRPAVSTPIDRQFAEQETE